MICYSAVTMSLLRRLLLLSLLVFTYFLVSNDRVLGPQTVKACRLYSDCTSEFNACVDLCPKDESGSPQQTCYTACANTRDRCMSYCCFGFPGDGGSGCSPSCPMGCDASNNCL